MRAPKANSKISQDENRTTRKQEKFMIAPITFETGGATMPLFPIPDASGLTPLELPVGLIAHDRPAGSEQQQPAPDAIARFQAAMSEPAGRPLTELVARPPADNQRPAADTPAPATNSQQPTPPADTPKPPSDIQQPTTTNHLVADIPSESPKPSSDIQPQTADSPARLPTTALQPPTTAADVPRPFISQQGPDVRQPATDSAPSVTPTAPRAPADIPAPVVTAAPRAPADIPAPVVTAAPRAPADNEEPDEIPTLQAAPIAAPVTSSESAPVATSAPVALEIDPAAATARTHELVEAASQVADTILVTPSLVHGEGEITIQLKPTVLDGSEIRLEAKGSSITVAVTPATQSVAQVIAQAQAQFEQTLVERLPSFQIAVTMAPPKSVRRNESTI